MQNYEDCIITLRYRQWMLYIMTGDITELLRFNSSIDVRGVAEKFWLWIFILTSAGLT